MKRAKIALLLTFTLAIIGGSLAKKSRMSGVTIYSGKALCTYPVVAYITGFGSVIFSFSTKPEPLCSFSTVPVLRIE